MSKKLVKVAALGAACVAFLAVSASAGSGWWDDLFEDKVVPLEAIMKTPESYRNQLVSFVMQYHKPGRIENPFYTKFETDWYMNLSCWPDSSALWEKEAYKRDFTYLFVRRTADASKELLAAPMYSRWIVVAEVCEVFKGTPWIEIRGLKRLETQMDEPSLVHIVKGLMLKDLRRHDAAADEFHAADHKNLPETVRAFILREEGTALQTIGRTDAAIARFELALNVWPSDPKSKEALAAARAVATTEKNQPPASKTTEDSVVVGEPATPSPAPTPTTEPAPAAEPEPTPSPVGGGGIPAGGGGG